MQLEQHVREHFAGRYVHLALADFVLQIGAVAHVLQRLGRIAFRKCDPSLHLARSILALVESAR